MSISGSVIHAHATGLNKPQYRNLIGSSHLEKKSSNTPTCAANPLKPSYMIREKSVPSLYISLQSIQTHSAGCCNVSFSPFVSCLLSLSVSRWPGLTVKLRPIISCGHTVPTARRLDSDAAVDDEDDGGGGEEEERRGAEGNLGHAWSHNDGYNAPAQSLLQRRINHKCNTLHR